MKTLTLLLLTIFLGKGCSEEAKNEMENTIIQYTANTRGFYKKITIQNKQVFVSRDRNSTEKGTPVAISDADWKELVGYFETVQLDSLPSYKDPTQKRFYDGAAMADLKIKHKDKEYQTVTFDHGFPPVEIEKLIKKITSFSKDE